VAERLGFLYVDEQIVSYAAAAGGVSPADVADAERRKSFVGRALEALTASNAEAWASGGGVTLGAADGLSSDDVRSLIRDAIEQTAARGDVVIVAHAASYAVRAGPGKLRVLVTASPETRAKRVGSDEGIDPQRAARAVEVSDAGRRDYLKRFYEIDQELPTHYDLVINTDVLSPAQAAELVLEAGSSQPL
jgi:hypothetical protein